MGVVFLIVGLVLGCGLGGVLGWTLCDRANAAVIPQLEERARNAQRSRLLAEEQLASHRAQSNASFAMLRGELDRERSRNQALATMPAPPPVAAPVSVEVAPAPPPPAPPPGHRSRTVSDHAEALLRARGLTTN